jgi:hypothetical protein
LYWQMIACVHDPISGWEGGPGPLSPSEVKALHAILPTPRDYIGQKVRIRAQPSRGVGGMEENTPNHAN